MAADTPPYETQLVSSTANKWGTWSLGNMCKWGKASSFMVGRTFGIDTIYGQPGGGTHQHLWGWAADYMVAGKGETRRKQLFAMRDYALANVERLNITQVIAYGTIATRSRDWKIRTYAPKGATSDSALHRNHMHLTFEVPPGKTDTQQDALNSQRYIVPTWPISQTAFKAGPWVTWTGWMLLARGGNQQYTPTPVWGKQDTSRLAAFQKAQGWTGANADGLMGPLTFKLLASGQGKDIKS